MDQAITEAEAQDKAATARYQEAQRHARELQAELSTMPADATAEINAIVAEMEGLPKVFASGEELDALRLKLRDLDQEAEVARQARANVAAAVGANPQALEKAGQAIRAAIKGWDQGKAEAYAAVVGPIEARMSEALGAPVTIDPANNWTVTVKDGLPSPGPCVGPEMCSCARRRRRTRCT